MMEAYAQPQAYAAPVTTMAYDPAYQMGAPATTSMAQQPVFLPSTQSMIAYPGMATTGPFQFTVDGKAPAAPVAAGAPDAVAAPAKAAEKKKSTKKKKKGCCA